MGTHGKNPLDAPLNPYAEFMTILKLRCAASYTPIIIKKKSDDLVRIIAVEDIEGVWREASHGKEYCDTPGVQTWTDEGWTNLNRVIRHKIDKDLVRVVTHTGIVDVTDEHSLLDANKAVVRPKDCAVGTAMLHADLPVVRTESDEFSVDEARILGFFAGDGSCGCYDCPSGKKNTFAMNNASLSCLRFYKSLCEKVYPDYDWVIMDTLNSSGVRKLSPRSRSYGSIVNFVQVYRRLMYSGLAKNIPVGILNGSYDVRRSFWNGFYDADGYKAGDKNIEISQKNQITCAQLTFLAYSLGYKHVVLSDREDKPDIFRLRIRNETQQLRKGTDTIKVLRRVQSTPYVYDLTTENHHFAAGIGRLVVHNTDSIMVKMGLPQDDLAEHFRVATWLAAEISKTFKPPHDLEFEKLYAPYILYSKKRYAAMKYESLTDKPKRDVKGIALVRRDNAPIVKDVLSECLDALLVDKSPAEALNIAREHVRRVLDNEHALDKFVISKTLRTDYKMDTQPHVFVARKIFQRRGFPVPSGSRVPFVYVEDKLHPRAVQSSKAEDPEYAIHNKLVVDRLYYINQQLRKPLVSLLEPVDANPDTAIFDHEIIRDKLGVLVSGFKADVIVAKRVDTNAKNHQREITSFFTKKVPH